MNRKALFGLCGIGVICVVVILVWFVITGGFPKETQDVDDYLWKEDFLGYSDLLVFPESLPESEAAPEYYFYGRDAFFDPVCQVYLRCEYSEQDFVQECERLSQIETTYQGQNKKVQLVENKFIMPAYVAIDGWNCCYEYALVDETNSTIEYIYIQNIDKKAIRFDTSKLPDTYGQLEKEGLQAYTIYVYEMPEGFVHIF